MDNAGQKFWFVANRVGGDFKLAGLNFGGLFKHDVLSHWMILTKDNFSFQASFCPSTDVTSYLVRAGSEQSNVVSDPNIFVV